MEEKDVQRLLDMLYSMIDEAKSAAFSSDKCVISRDEALDLLDDIRAKLPLEIKKAQELVRAREEYVSSAKKEVEKMLRQAELDAKVIVSESETLQQARRKSSEIIRRAEERSKELYHVANTYTEDALRRTEEAIQAALDEVKESRVRFRATSNEQMQANQEKLREKQHPAKRSFQAIRIAVNGELEELPPMLRAAAQRLHPGGRLAVISFHSLEDRIIKKTMQELATGCTCPPNFPVCVCGKKPQMKLVSRKPIVATEAELTYNPRARSAKLRVAEKL